MGSQQTKPHLTVRCTNATDLPHETPFVTGRELMLPPELLQAYDVSLLPLVAQASAVCSPALKIDLHLLLNSLLAANVHSLSNAVLSGLMNTAAQFDQLIPRVNMFYRMDHIETILDTPALSISFLWDKCAATYTDAWRTKYGPRALDLILLDVASIRATFAERQSYAHTSQASPLLQNNRLCAYDILTWNEPTPDAYLHVIFGCTTRLMSSLQEIGSDELLTDSHPLRIASKIPFSTLNISHILCRLRTIPGFSHTDGKRIVAVHVNTTAVNSVVVSADLSHGWDSTNHSLCVTTLLLMSQKQTNAAIHLFVNNGTYDVTVSNASLRTTGVAAYTKNGMSWYTLLDMRTPPSDAKPFIVPTLSCVI
jgi:hypothetical protein